MGRERTWKRKHLLIFFAGVTLLLPACTAFWTPEGKKLEKARVEIDQLHRDVDRCRHDTSRLQQENDRLRQELEKVRKDIEKARKVDMEIEQMRRNLGR